MRSSARILLSGLVLLSTAGCDRLVHSLRQTTYVPTQAGLTLVYEDPTQPSGPENRFQVRVASSKETPEGTLVRMGYTTLQGQMETLSLVRNGGKSLLLEGNRKLLILPEGFPDRVSRWEIQGASARVIGRAEADLPGLDLPPGADRVGVWVQFDAPEGRSRRVFYLPRFGEAQTLVQRDGKWICTNRLIKQGVSDAPLIREK